MKILLENSFFQLVLAFATLIGGWAAYKQIFQKKSKEDISLHFTGKSKIRNLIEKSNKDDANAQFELAEMYFDGEGIDENKGLAIQLLQKSANLNNRNAQNLLGYIYGEGDGTTVDIDKGIFWIKKAVENQSPIATRNLSNAYLAGLGVERNMKMAIKLQKKAAELGDKESQYMHGLYLFDNELGQKNIEEGKKWIQKAANQGHPDAQYRIGLEYFSKIKDTGILNTTQTVNNAANVGLAIKWLTHSSEQGNSEASYLLSQLYSLTDENFNIYDEKKASYFVKRAIDQGHEEATKKYWDQVSENLDNILDDLKGTTIK